MRKNDLIWSSFLQLLNDTANITVSFGCFVTKPERIRHIVTTAMHHGTVDFTIMLIVWNSVREQSGRTKLSLAWVWTYHIAVFNMTLLIQTHHFPLGRNLVILNYVPFSWSLLSDRQSQYNYRFKQGRRSPGPEVKISEIF